MGAIPRFPTPGDASAVAAAQADWTAGTAGAVQRALNAKLADQISPEDYGAAADGSTDDTAAFTAALAAVDVLHLRRGRTYVANISVPGGKTIIGHKATLKSKTLAANNGSPIITVTGPLVSLTGIRFDGNRSAQPADGFSDSFNGGLSGQGRAYRCGVLIDGVTNPTAAYLSVEQCEFRNLFGGGVVGRDTVGVDVNNNLFKDCNFEALWISKTSAQTTDVQFNNNRIINVFSGHANINANGIVFSGVSRGNVAGNRCYNVERDFIKIESPSTDIAVVGNVVDTITYDNFVAVQIQPLGTGIAKRITISGNTFYNVGAGIAVNAGSTATAEDIVITDNVISLITGSSQGDGIIILGGVTGFVVKGNVVRGAKRYGIRLRSSTGAMQGGVVEGNVLSGANASSSTNQGIDVFADNDISDVLIKNNTLNGFTTVASNGWINLAATAGKYLNRVIIRDNVINCSVVTQRALWQSGDICVDCLITGNHIGGAILVQSPGVEVRDNYLLGASAGIARRAVSSVSRPLEGLAGATPTYGLSNQGDILPISAAAASGTGLKVCTTTGGNAGGAWASSATYTVSTGQTWKRASNNRVYKLVTAGGGTTSVEPTGTTIGGQETGADGYVWQCMASTSARWAAVTLGAAEALP
jgi:hypothetical protein